MTNNDISLLKYCFSVAGHKNQRETTGWLYKVSKCLQNAGAENILIDEKRRNCFFRSIMEGCQEKRTSYNTK